MKDLDKLNQLTKAAKFDISDYIYPACTTQGKTVNLFKILLSNACLNNCDYCANRFGRDFRRLSFKEEELAKLFIMLYEKRLVDGLFLSSGIAYQGVNDTMQRMIKTIEIIRNKYKFKGYIHLKILPKASYDMIEEAMKLADRVSLNLEAPNAYRLRLISKDKDFNKDLLTRLLWIKTLKRNLLLKGKKISVTTQFVVGAADEPDIEILKTANFLYKKVGISRSYFSAFIPITDTPLSSKKPTPWLREFRLYQADFLLRNYNFKPEELTTCNLDLRLDPKLNWAMNNPQNFPVEINKAEEFQLLRIPGIGPETAKRIISHRIKNRFHNLQELRSIGVIIKRAVNFITINGKSYRQFI